MYEWAWSILKASSQRADRTEARSYWLGFFDSDVTTFTRDRGHVFAVSDSSGSHVVGPPTEAIYFLSAWPF
jgi:hypothetical protein